ncbi:hypothetical protein [Brevibacterium sediminis]
MTEEQMTDERPPRTIRMFPDYAGTVLWISMPIDYEDAGLSGALVAQLEAWEKSYYDSLDSDFNWVPETAARIFAEQGVHLARLVSAEVGPQFVVEISSSDDDTEAMRIRAEHSAENPKAEAAFTRLFDEAEADDRRIAELVRNEPDGEWTAYAPLSGTVFKPNSNEKVEPPTEAE